jgi:catechol 2,3-dioxygenase-like lactoylglutathione lyase family enzyme
METMTHVRYMVNDVGEAVDFYTKHFGFEPMGPSSPAFASVIRDNLRLMLSGPESSAGRPMPDGARPGPGGWNRIHFHTADLDAEIARLVQDPSGNLIELFQPAPGFGA